MRTNYIFITIGFLFVTLFSSGIERNDQVPVDTFLIKCGQSNVKLKVSYPLTEKVRDKIILWANHPTSTAFIDESTQNDVNMSIELRRNLLAAGYINVEYIGRKDTVSYYGHRYSFATVRTSADDMIVVIDWLRNSEKFKKKKIITVGASFGGVVNVMCYNERSNDICGLLQLSTYAISSEEFLYYQNKKREFDNMLIFTHHCTQKNMDKTTNKLSSLDSYYTADMNGYLKAKEEHNRPVDSIVTRYVVPDSIYYHLDNYIHGNWNKEDEETKKGYRGNYELYYKLFTQQITPEQIATRFINVKSLYPVIKCPLLALFGTKDELMDSEKNEKEMRYLVNENGNHKYKSMILKNYDHQLTKSLDDEHYQIDKKYINKVLKWIGSL